MSKLWIIFPAAICLTLYEPNQSLRMSSVGYGGQNANHKGDDEGNWNSEPEVAVHIEYYHIELALASVQLAKSQVANK